MFVAVVVLVLVLVVAAPRASGGNAPRGGLLPWHRNPVTCDDDIGAMPAGLVDDYLTRGSVEVHRYTPLDSTNGPWIMVFGRWVDLDVYALKEEGTGPTAELLWGSWYTWAT